MLSRSQRPPRPTRWEAPRLSPTRSRSPSSRPTATIRARDSTGAASIRGGKRTGPAPVMMTLNASKRDVCRVRREVTASPLQAFVLLNSPQFVEASRVMADQSPSRSIKNDARLLLSSDGLPHAHQPSPPGKSEAKDSLRTLFEEQLAHFEAEPRQGQAELVANRTRQGPRRICPPIRWPPPRSWSMPS